MLSNTTFNNISVISWLSILLVVKIREKHWPAAIQWQYLSHNVLSITPRHEWDSSSQHQLITWIVINPYYHTLTTTMLCNMIYKRCHSESRQYFFFFFLQNYDSLASELIFMFIFQVQLEYILEREGGWDSVQVIVNSIQQLISTFCIFLKLFLFFYCILNSVLIF
jgi:hypothetical protein